MPTTLQFARFGALDNVKVLKPLQNLKIWQCGTINWVESYIRTRYCSACQVFECIMLYCW